MITALNRLFKRQKNRKPLLISEVKFSEMSQQPKLIDEIFDEKIDGVIIRNFLNKVEVQQLLNAYLSIPISEQFCTGEGIHTFPESFYSLNGRPFNEADFLKNKSFWEGFEQSFGMDYVSKVKKLFLQLSSAESINIPVADSNMNQIYNPSTFRQLSPESGEFKLHCGRFFHEAFPDFYKQLNTLSDIHHQLSYFVTLRPAEEGGELKLYDPKWEEANKKADGLKLEDMNGKIIDLEDPSQASVSIPDLREGDLFIFKGSNIWHQVSSIRGAFSRCTLGSFITQSKTENQLHLWS